MTRKTLKVALLQETDRGSRDANLDAIETGLREAAAAGAELVLLQELHNGPYFCQRESVEVFDQAESIPGPGTERIGKLAAELKLVVVASLFERRAAGLYHNTAVVFDRSAAIAGVYRKMHIPDDPGFYEKFYFTPGDLGFEPIDTSVGRLGVLVCWDQWYPEAGRWPAPSCCSTPPPSAGIPLTSKPRRTASATPGSPCSAATPWPTACPCSPATVPASKPIPPTRPRVSSSGVPASSPDPRANSWPGRVPMPANCCSRKSTWAAARTCAGSGRSCVTAASTPTPTC